MLKNVSAEPVKYVRVGDQCFFVNTDTETYLGNTLLTFQNTVFLKIKKQIFVILKRLGSAGSELEDRGKLKKYRAN